MIDICEVGLRDGLQNESKLLTTEQKVEMIRRLIKAGIRYIEAISFVNPKIVPQMSDAEEVLRYAPREPELTYAGLVLSRSGAERAFTTQVDAIHAVVAVSDEFNLRNAKRTAEQSLIELIPVVKDAILEGKRTVGVLGTAFGCPFSGDIPIESVFRMAECFLEAGCERIVLADTTGLANPLQVKNTVHDFTERFGAYSTLGLHFHNTRGLGLANVYAGYEAGVRHFDSSIAGLGGCPFAPRAVGNVCTEDMVHLFHQIGEETGNQLDLLIDTAKWTELQMGRRLDGMLMRINE